MRNSRFTLLALMLVALLSGCNKFDEIQIRGINDVQFNGLMDSKLLLTIALDVENPNSTSLKIKAIELTAWLDKREFGTLRTTEKITLKGKSRTECRVPIEIQLRTAADALLLLSNRERLLEQMTVEGYIKGGKFPVIKKIRIEKQPIRGLLRNFNTNK